MRRAPAGLAAPFAMELRHRYPPQLVESYTTPAEEYIVIGEVINSFPREVAKIYANDIFRHVLIAGATGSGKTRTASTIARRVSEVLGLPVLVLDWHGEYSGLLANSALIRPIEMPMPIYSGRADDLDAISNILDLTQPQEFLLEKLLSKGQRGALSIDSFIRAIEAYPEEASWMRETKISLLRKLGPLNRPHSAKFFEVKPAGGLAEMLSLIEAAGRPVVVRVSDIEDPDARKMYTGLLVKRAVDYFLENGKPLVIVLEESQNYLSSSRPMKLLLKMLREVRKYRIGLMIIAQSPSRLSNDVLANTGTKILHSMKSGEDLEAVNRALYLDRALRNRIAYLSPGEAVFHTTYLKKPVLIYVS